MPVSLGRPSDDGIRPEPILALPALFPILNPRPQRVGSPPYALLPYVLSRHRPTGGEPFELRNHLTAIELGAIQKRCGRPSWRSAKIAPSGSRFGPFVAFMGVVYSAHASIHELSRQKIGRARIAKGALSSRDHPSSPRPPWSVYLRKGT